MGSEGFGSALKKRRLAGKNLSGWAVREFKGWPVKDFGGWPVKDLGGWVVKDLGGWPVKDSGALERRLGRCRSCQRLLYSTSHPSLILDAVRNLPPVCS